MEPEKPLPVSGLRCLAGGFMRICSLPRIKREGAVFHEHARKVDMVKKSGAPQKCQEEAGGRPTLQAKQIKAAAAKATAR